MANRSQTHQKPKAQTGRNRHSQRRSPNKHNRRRYKKKNPQSNSNFHRKKHHHKKHNRGHQRVRKNSRSLSFGFQDSGSFHLILRWIGLVFAACAIVILVASIFVIVTMVKLVPSSQWLSDLTYSVSVVAVADTNSKLDLVEVIYPSRTDSQHVKQPFIDLLLEQEDRQFLNHSGVSIKNFARAIAGQFIIGNQGGGSTITMQLARHLTLTSREKTISRKFAEILVARRIEAVWTKDEILSAYLSTVYLGKKNHGFENAANYYFGRPLNRLSKEQWASLVVTLPCPSRCYPGTEKNQTRRYRLLNVTQGNLKLKKRPQHQPRNNAGLIFIAKQAAKRIRIEPGQKYIINTTIHPQLQEKVVKVAANVDRQLKRSQLDAGVNLIMKDGKLLAFTGFGSRAISLLPLLDNRRQSGSLLKPFIVFTALEDNLDPNKLVSGRALQGVYRPKNADGQYPREVSLETLLSRSINTASVRLFLNHRKKFDKLMNKLLPDWNSNNLSRALGTVPQSLVDLTNAYALFGNSSVYRPRSVFQIRLSTGTILYRSKQKVLFKKSAHSDSNSKIVAQYLESVVSYGTAKAGGRYLGGLKVAGKTGTTDQSIDKYFVAFSRQRNSEFIFTAWVGNLDNRPVTKIPPDVSPVLIVAKTICRIYQKPRC